MQKLTMSGAVMTAAVLFSTHSHAAENGTVSFSGQLTGSTCDASVEGQGPDATIVLPTETADEVNTKGEAGKTPFTITLSNCQGSYGTARAYFEGGSTVSTNYTLLNTGGTASGVHLILRTAADTFIKPGIDASMQNGQFYDISSGSATMNYNISYISNANTGGPATGGTVKSSVTYSIEYK
ncbi:TPA: type 1 fimbrial protein [Enterobacter hormaechei subsp. steigerwaltii]|nr:type 1 fimbrial protein [Enterobacter hormaechei subsp. steigerwaltii]